MPSLVLSKIDKEGTSEYFKHLQKEENNRMADQYHKMLKTKTESTTETKLKEKKSMSSAEKHILKVQAN